MFWKSIVLIIVLALVGGLSMGLLAKHRQQTTYIASRNVLISHNLTRYSSNTSRNGQSTSIVTDDQQMMDTYKDVVDDNQILIAAKRKLPKKLQQKYSVNDLHSIVSAKSKPQTLILTVKAETKSAKNSAIISNAVSSAFKEQIPNIQPGAGHIALLGKAKAKYANSVTRPHAKKYAAVGVVLGGLVGIIISFSVITLKDLKKEARP